MLQVALIDLMKNYEDPYLLITGDITFKGKADGYELAKKFIQSLIDEGVLKRNRFLSCPGNHDIVNGVSPFKLFTEFCYYIRQDDLLNFEDNEYIKFKFPDSTYSILLINSVCHEDQGYGLFSDSTISELENISKSKKDWLVATHHHLIPCFRSDISTTRNAYSLLHWASTGGVKLTLHGHQHSNLNLTVGVNEMMVRSCRSFSFGSFPIQNGGNVISIDREIVTKSFTAIHDSIPNKINFNIAG